MQRGTVEKADAVQVEDEAALSGRVLEPAANLGGIRQIELSIDLHDRDAIRGDVPDLELVRRHRRSIFASVTRYDLSDVCRESARGTLSDVTDSGFPLHVSNGATAVEDFRIEEVRPAGCSAFVYILYGEVDLHVASELRERLNDAIDGEPENVVVDLSSVTFLDSMALGVLLGAHKRLRETGGELELIVPSPELRRVFEITLLDEVFTLARTRQEALAAFTSSWEP